MLGETEDKEVQQTTAHLMLRPAAVGWRWQQSPGQASKFSLSLPQKPFLGENVLGCQSEEATSVLVSILDPDRVGWMKKWHWMSVMVQPIPDWSAGHTGDWIFV